MSLKIRFLYETGGCNLWAQVEKLCVPFVVEKACRRITHPRKLIYTVIVYFSQVLWGVEGMWIMCNVPAVCWVLCVHIVFSSPACSAIPNFGRGLPVQSRCKYKRHSCQLRAFLWWQALSVMSHSLFCNVWFNFFFPIISIYCSFIQPLTGR